jgi:L-seryl-tRNA(Ser) seleniumtransferase
VTAQLRGEDVLAHVNGRPPLVPYEAAAALAMLLHREHGIMTVHFAAVPPGTSALLFKFVPPDLLERFGGPERFADAVAACVDRLAEIVGDGDALRRLLLG